MDRGTDYIRLPDLVGIHTESAVVEKQEDCFEFEDICFRTVLKNGELQVFVRADNTPLRQITLLWKKEAEGHGKILADHWERGYGDFEWKEETQNRVMPWYFVDDRKNCCRTAGVKVRPGSMCWWEIMGTDLLLHLDVRCGGKGVVLKNRELPAASVIMKSYEQTDAFDAGVKFCREMCKDPLISEKPVYGGNNWYYAYGVSSKKEILKDCEFLAALTKGIENRPFMVIDDGWQIAHTDKYNGGPWDRGNADYGDMGQLASEMKKADVRPGIWFRPLLDASVQIPAEWKLSRQEEVLDISVPEVLQKVREDINRIREWGFELVKHDFSTFDIFGRWGFEMEDVLTADEWQFRDTSKTTAELIVEFYRTVKEAAGEMLILGCNCVGHLGAGLMHMNRNGDDTSGVEWERTKKMGVNTLAFRMAQNRTFFGADADCVGITEKISWEKNRQWMKLLSVSATPFFVSVAPGILNREQQEELAAACRKAAENTIQAVPMDWKENKVPEKWQTFEGIAEFSF